MSHYHAVVWVDHREARIFYFNQAEVDRAVLYSDKPTRHIHQKANIVASGHAEGDARFPQEISAAIAVAGEILVVGPGNAKTELVSYIKKHDPKLAQRIVGVETVDHPTDAQLVAHARAYFKAADRMLPQKG